MICCTSAIALVRIDINMHKVIARLPRQTLNLDLSLSVITNAKGSGDDSTGADVTPLLALPSLTPGPCRTIATSNQNTRYLCMICRASAVAPVRL